MPRKPSKTPRWSKAILLVLVVFLLLGTSLALWPLTWKTASLGDFEIRYPPSLYKHEFETYGIRKTIILSPFQSGVSFRDYGFEEKVRIRVDRIEKRGPTDLVEAYATEVYDHPLAFGAVIKDTSRQEKDYFAREIKVLGDDETTYFLFIDRGEHIFDIRVTFDQDLNPIIELYREFMIKKALRSIKLES